MGADVFFTRARGGTAKEAFIEAVDDAYYEYGHNGYTGTIAEKDGFVMIKLPEGMDPVAYADTLIANDDDRISNKWGPAGCIELPDNEYLFFGWASC